MVITNIEIGSPLFYKNFCKVLKYLKNLRYLSLVNCGLNKPDELNKFTCSLCYLNSLQYLNLSDNNLDTKSMILIFLSEYKNEPFNVLGFIPALNHLDISEYREGNMMVESTNITNESEIIPIKKQFFSEISCLKLITELSLRGRGLTSCLFELAGSIKFLVFLRSLDISSNFLKMNDLAEFFDQISENCSLEILDLSDNIFGDDGFFEIQRNLNKFVRLKILSVKNNGIAHMKRKTNAQHPKIL